MAKKIPFTFKILRDGNVEGQSEAMVELPGVIKVGKLDSSQLKLDDESVSRMHAVIEVGGPDEIQIMDLGSAGGTFVNDTKATSRVPIKPGDVLRFGDLTIHFEVGQEQEEAAPAAEAPAAEAPAAAAAPAAVPAPGVPAPGVVAPSVGAAAPAAMAVDQQNSTAYMPTPDPSVDVQDGSRAIEVTAMFQDSVLAVRHLDNPGSGKVSGLTWGFVGIGVAIGGTAIVLAVMGQKGFGALLMMFGMLFTTYGITRLSRERQSPNFLIGEGVNSDLHVTDQAVPVPEFPLVRADGGSYSLLFTAGMKGEVSINDQAPVDLQSLAGAGQAHNADISGAFSYGIPSGARVQLEFGDNVFWINSVPRSRRVAAPPLLAGFAWGGNGVSVAAHGLVAALVLLIPPDEKSLSLDLFNTDNKLLKYLNKPPEDKEEEVPEWLKKKGPDEAGGKGQKHKGDEGKMGKKTSKKKSGLYGLKGPKDASPQLAKRLAENAAQTAGVLGILKSDSGSHIASIFGKDQAIGNDAENALGGLIGDQIGESYGLGGLGLAGEGRGGGGTGEGTIGLGSLGTIGKGGGGGSGAGYGRGAGRLGGRRARAPKVIAGRADVRGALDKEIIRRIIRRHINEVKYCYQKELEGNEKLNGRVVVQFTISPTGRVIVSKVQSSTVGNRKVEGCIAKAVRRWLFPKPKGGGIVIVAYPFVLRAAGG